MDKRRSRFVPGAAFVGECLESRVVLSATSAGGVAEVASHAGRAAATRTTLGVSAGTLGQPMVFTATVRASAAAGSPTGSVEILDHGNVLGSIPLTFSSTSGRSAISEGTGTLTFSPGGTAFYFGKHKLSAKFIPAGSFAKSTAKTSFTVSQPAYTTLDGGVQIATIAQGMGPQIQAGQTAGVLYTGYLAKNGEVFDDSSSHGLTPLQFTVGAGQVVAGFDEGTAGMTVGETRIVSIPPAEGYGSTANGSIPANSSLIFVVTLESIS